MESKKIALIGAGLSNLGFLYSIKPSDAVNVTLFEKSKVICGRAATRTRGEYTYDNGANYFNATDERLINIINQIDNLKEIKKWIYPFDKDNKINFDKQLATPHNEKIKYTFKTGIKDLGKWLFANKKLSNFEIKYEKDITNIKKEGNKLKLISNDTELGEFDYVIMGIPSPNIYRILKNNPEQFSEILPELETYRYKKIYSLAIAYDITPFDFYALINSDREHPISWVSMENEKRDDIKGTLLIVQMSNNFSVEHFGKDQGEVTKMIVSELHKLLPELSDKTILFSDLKMWGHALPEKPIDVNLISKLESFNLFPIGDCVNSKGRVDGAILSGLDMYEKIQSKF